MINRKSSLFLVLMFTILFLSGLYYIPVNAAFSYTNTTLTSDYNFNNDDDFVTLPNGNLLIAIAKYTTVNYVIHLYQVNSAGTLIADTTVFTATSAYEQWRDLSVTLVSATLVYVCVAGGTRYTGVAGPFGSVVIIKYNPTSLAYSKVSRTISGPNLTAVDFYASCSKMYLYGGFYYCIVNVAGTYGAGASASTYYTYLMKYTPDTTLIEYSVQNLNHAATPAFKYIAPVNLFFDSSNGVFYYTTGNDYDGFILYKTTLSTHADDVLATYAMPSDFPIPSTDTMSVDAGFKYVGNGYVVNGTDIWLWFAQIKGYVLTADGISTIAYKFVETRFKFNTSITSATLLLQDRRALTGSLGNYLWTPWVNGFSTSKSAFTLYVENRILSGLYDTTSQPKEITIALTGDWFNTPTVSATVVNMIGTLPYLSGATEYTFASSGDFINQYYIIQGTGTGTRVYRGLTSVNQVWSYSLTWTPNDAPQLDTDTNYRFTFNIHVNGIDYSNCKVYLYIDDIAYTSSGSSPNNGIFEFTYTTSVAGDHDIEFIVKDLDGVTQIDVTYFFTFAPASPIDGGGGTDTGTTETSVLFTTGLLYNILPMGVLLLAPSVLLFSVTKHWVGFIAGLTLGAFIAVIGNVIPIYGLFIVVVIDLLIIMFARGSATGG